MRSEQEYVELMMLVDDYDRKSGARSEHLATEAEGMVEQADVDAAQLSEKAAAADQHAMVEAEGESEQVEKYEADKSSALQDKADRIHSDFQGRNEAHELVWADIKKLGNTEREGKLEERQTEGDRKLQSADEMMASMANEAVGVEETREGPKGYQPDLSTTDGIRDFISHVYQNRNQIVQRLGRKIMES